jgi:hypothetical protein
VLQGHGEARRWPSLGIAPYRTCGSSTGGNPHYYTGVGGVRFGTRVLTPRCPVSSPNRVSLQHAGSMCGMTRRTLGRRSVSTCWVQPLARSATGCSSQDKSSIRAVVWSVVRTPCFDSEWPNWGPPVRRGGDHGRGRTVVGEAIGSTGVASSIGAATPGRRVFSGFSLWSTASMRTPKAMKERSAAPSTIHWRLESPPRVGIPGAAKTLLVESSITGGRDGDVSGSWGTLRLSVQRVAASSERFGAYTRTTGRLDEAAKGPGLRSGSRVLPK